MAERKITIIPVPAKSQENRARCLAAGSVTRYVVTHMGRNGMRTLASPAQGRFTYATREEAESMLKAMLSNNSEDTLRSVYGFPLEVRACECWPEHFDPKGIYFDTGYLT